MSDFFTNLWESVFTPGTTPTLLVATNVTFAALQLLLGTLLFTTYSIHFLILSVLCGGLWVSINWFANELKQAQAKEEEAERLRKRAKAEPEWKRTGQVEDSADDEGEDTEVEDAAMKESRDSLAGGSQQTVVPSSTGIASSGLQPPDTRSSTRLRRPASGDRSGEISTDSEWEKVDGER